MTRKAFATFCACFLVTLSASAAVFELADDFRPRFEIGGGGVNWVVASPDGGFYAAGTFSSAGGAVGAGIVRFQADGTPDPTFKGPPDVMRLAIQPDGKLLVQRLVSPNIDNWNVYIARLNPDGSADPTWSTDVHFDNARGFFPLANGKVIVLGSLSGDYNTSETVLLRLKSDGTLDTSFASALSSESNPTAVAELADGRLLVAGSNLYLPDNQARLLVRIQDDGTIDEAFSPDLPSSHYGDSALALQPDGKILIRSQFTEGTEQTALIRLNADGSRDTSFSAVGVLESGISIKRIIVEPDGKLFIIGGFAGGVGRLLPDGSRDTTFSQPPVSIYDGTRLTSGQYAVGGDRFIARLAANGTPEPGFSNVVAIPAGVWAAARRSDGTWYVGGQFKMVNGETVPGNLVRLNADGALDPTFAPTDFLASLPALLPTDDGGVVTGGTLRYFDSTGTPVDKFPTIAGGSGATVDALLRQPDGKILVAGSFATVGGSPRGSIARFNTDGTLDTTFTSGVGFIDQYGRPGGVTALALQPDGRILAAGSFTSYNGSGRTGIIRLNSDGSIDTSFVTDGGWMDSPTAIIVRPDGRIIITGSSFGFGGRQRQGLVQLDPSGSVDPDFSPDLVGGFVKRAWLDTDGSLWVIGRWLQLSDGSRVSAARISEDGSEIEPVKVQGASLPGEAVLFEPAGNGGFFVGGSELAVPDLFTIALGRIAPAPVPVITAQPISQNVAGGTTVTFSVEATGADLAYQWFHNGKPIEGATDRTLTLTNVTWQDAGDYQVEIRNIYDTVMSEPARLGGINPAPTITAHPQSTDAVEGTSITLAVGATTAGTPGYQWRKFGEPIPGATSQNLNISAAEFADAGLYDVVVTDGLSFTIANPARVAIRPQPMANVFMVPAPFGPKLEKPGGRFSRLVPAPDGKIYVLGEFSGFGDVDTARIARLNADGSPDTTFAPAQIADGTVNALAIDAQGRLVIGGSFTVVGDFSRRGIARLHPDGSVDTSFDPGSGFDSQFHSYESVVSDIAIQPDGRIIAGGDFRGFRGAAIETLVRITENGSLDLSFSSPLDSGDRVMAVALQPDGRILAGGDITYPPGNVGWHLVRLEPNGTIDPTFDTGWSSSTKVEDIVIQPDGKVLVGVDSPRSSQSSDDGLPHGIARLNADGSRDGTFDPQSELQKGLVTSIHLLPDGKILACGRVVLKTDQQVYTTLNVLQLSPDGVLEKGWADENAASSDGPRAVAARPLSGGDILVCVEKRFTYPSVPDPRTMLRLSPEFVERPEPRQKPRLLASVNVLAAAPGGRWVIGGDFTRVDGREQGGIAVLLEDGSPDPAFAPETGFDGQVAGLAVDGLGRIVAGGMFSSYDGRKTPVVARLSLSGSLDKTFVPWDGLIPSDELYYRVPVAVGADGRILVGGAFGTGGSTTLGNPLRLLADGSLDPDFQAGRPQGGYLFALMAEPDGHVLVSGDWSGYGENWAQGVVRLNADGSFSASLHPGGNTDGTRGIDLLADGRVVASFGSSVLRFMPDTTYDPTFAAPGQVDTGFPRIGALAVDSQGRILVARSSATETPTWIRRLDASGLIDPRFKIVGTLSTAEPPTVHALAYAQDSTILVGGTPFAFEGGINSGLVRLVRAPAPLITAQPVDVSAQPGGTVQFSVTATGENIQYQWKFNGRDIPGATSSTLTLTNVQLTDAGEYTVALTNEWDTIVSEPAHLAGPNPAPTIGRQPVSIETAVGGTATLTVEATGEGPLSYQWRKFGEPIPGANTPTLTIAAAEFTDAGFYDVLVADGLSFTASHGVEIRVNPTAFPNVYERVPGFGPTLETTLGSVSHLLAAPDGDFFATGLFVRVDGQPRPGLARFNPDGSLDTNFAPADLGGMEVSAMALQPDGALIVATARDSAPSEFGLLRLLPSGERDSTFSGPDAIDGAITSIVVQSNGDIVIGGSFQNIGGQPAGRIARLKSHGAIDTSFATGTGFNQTVKALALQSTGDIIALGNFQHYGITDARFIARLRPTGEIDPSFKPWMTDPANAIVVLPDDKFLIGSKTNEGLIRRFHTDGSLDSSFQLQAVNNDYGWATAMTVDSAGNIIAALYLRNSLTDTYYGRLERYRPDGKRDPGFQSHTFDRGILREICRAGTNGIVVTGFFNLIDGDPARNPMRFAGDGTIDGTFQWETATPAPANVVAPDTGGSWLVAGSFDLVDGIPAPPLIRILADGSVDPSFAAELPPDAAIGEIFHEIDGSITLVGRFGETASDPREALIRLRPDGSRDTSFSGNLPPDTTLLHAARMADGSFLVSGYRTALNRSQFFVERVLPDGTVDTGFGQDLEYHDGGTINIATLPDGRAYLSSRYIAAPGHELVPLRRIFSDGSIDATFAPSGLPDDNVDFIAPDMNGRLWIGGRFRESPPLSSTLKNVVRLRQDGTRDSSFNLPSPLELFIQEIVPLPDGGALVGGVVSALPDRQSSQPLVRLQANGAINPYFRVLELANYGHVRNFHYTPDGGLLAAGYLDFGQGRVPGMHLLRPVDGPRIVKDATPPSASFTEGGTGITLEVDAVGNGDVHYQWQRKPLGSGDFTDIPRANGLEFPMPSPQMYHNGVYRLVVTAEGESVTSSEITVEVEPTELSAEARLLNLSTRGVSLSGDDVLIPGFVVQGTGQKRLLIRAVGPTLGGFGVPDALPDPVLELKQTVDGEIVTLAANDNWGDDPAAAQMPTVNLQVGAFDLAPGSGDAALLHDLAPGAYTVVAGDKNGARGIAIVELYDADAAATPSARLVNISNRGFAGTGDEVMIPGFVVSSEGPKRLLIRVVGPTLGTFGVQGFMPDPKLTVLRANPDGSSTEILWQDNWQDLPSASETATIAEQVGAFPLDEKSADAAFVVTLHPGSYTIAGSSADGLGTGVVLVEVYVVE